MCVGVWLCGCVGCVCMCVGVGVWVCVCETKPVGGLWGGSVHALRRVAAGACATRRRTGSAAGWWGGGGWEVGWFLGMETSVIGHARVHYACDFL